MIKKYKILPHTPDQLDTEGEKYFKIYADYFLQRDYLTSDLLPALESLAFLEQQRLELEKDIQNNGKDKDSINDLTKIATTIRLMKSDLKISVRANEFSKSSTKEKEEKVKEEAPTLKLAKKAF